MNALTLPPAAERTRLQRSWHRRRLTLQFTGPRLAPALNRPAVAAPVERLLGFRTTAKQPIAIGRSFSTAHRDLSITSSLSPDSDGLCICSISDSRMACFCDDLFIAA